MGRPPRGRLLGRGVAARRRRVPVVHARGLPDDVRRSRDDLPVGAPPPPGAAAPSRGPRPVKLPAPDYCASLFTWADALLADPAALPQARDAPFPPAFRAAVAPLFKRLARVFAHLYHAHFAHVEAIGAVPHLNTVFKHFVAFGRAHALVPERELDPVRELVDALLPPGAGGGGGGGG